ncbi:hypothetical protein [Streptomyces sp. NPDC007984]
MEWLRSAARVDEDPGLFFPVGTGEEERDRLLRTTRNDATRRSAL